MRRKAENLKLVPDSVESQEFVFDANSFESLTLIQTDLPFFVLPTTDDGTISILNFKHVQRISITSDGEIFIYTADFERRLPVEQAREFAEKIQRMSDALKSQRLP